MIQRRRSLIINLPLMIFLLAASDVNADCNVPAIYELMTETPNTVVICMSDSRGECPHDDGMLRQQVGTSSRVLLHDDCVPKEGDWGTYSGGSCYIDECVPPGSYRYGYADAVCVESACYTDYFGTVTVTEPLSDCERTRGTTLPEPRESGVPWGSEQWMCDYVSVYPPVDPPPDPYDVSTDPMIDTVVSDMPTDTPSGDTGENDDSPSDTASCGCSIPGHSSGIVLLANLMMLLVGLALLVVRRRR